MELFKLFGKIAIDNTEANKAIDETSDKGEESESKLGKAFSKIGSAAVAVGKTIAKGLAVASTAVVAIGKQAVSAYADYEQLVGGVETLFKDSAETVIQNASNAYKTAGMSANEYMETVTGFSASLLQSVGNDTVAAAEKADMAITDMSDNANKMGTSMESIQNAYQGFAKQNYTMLDNLKLGYGGTKEEMARLLEDATKLSGVEYDISSYADIVDAIHVVQTEMGITGTTAKEASTTIQGSITSMKASWQNLLTGMADESQDLDTLINNFFDSVVTVGDNLIPRISVVLDNIANLVAKLAPKLTETIPQILSTLLPAVVDGAVSLLDAVVDIFPELLNAIISALPSIIDGVQEIFNGLIDALPILIQGICNALPTLIPQLVTAIINMVSYLLAHIAEIIQPLIDSLPEIIIAIVQALMDNLPTLIEGCIRLVVGIVTALPQIIIALIEAIPTIITSIVEGLWSGAQDLWNAFSDIFSGAWESIKTTFEPVVEFFDDIFSKAWDGIENAWSSVGSFFSGIWDGIKNAFSSVTNWFGDTFSKAWSAVKNVFSAGGQIFDGIKDGILNAFKFVVNGIIDGLNWVIAQPFNGINNALRTIKYLDFWGWKPFEWLNEIPVPSIPKLAKGGIVEKETTAVIGEQGAEAIVPLENNTSWIDKISDKMSTKLDNTNKQPVKVEINLNIDKFINSADEDIEILAERLMVVMQEKINREELIFG